MLIVIYTKVTKISLPIIDINNFVIIFQVHDKGAGLNRPIYEE